MASQPPDTGRDRNQVRPLRSTVSSVRGKANRHRSTGVFGLHFVLDCGGSRKQAARFQDLLQQPSHPYLNRRANAESACVTTNRKSPLVSMATSLSILISDTSGCVIFRRLSIAPVSSTLGRLPIKSSGAGVLGCCALRGSDRFTRTVSIRQRHDVDGIDARIAPNLIVVFVVIDAAGWHAIFGSHALRLVPVTA